MKRKLMDQNMGSEIRCAIEELSVMVKVKGGILVPAAENGGGDHAHEAAHIPTRPFLSLCTLILQVLDKIGPTMAVLSQDVHQNIRRLETKHESDPPTYSNMVDMLKNEATEGIARNVTSCSRAFVWLTSHHHHHHQDPTILPPSNKNFNIPPIKTAPPTRNFSQPLGRVAQISGARDHEWGCSILEANTKDLGEWIWLAFMAFSIFLLVCPVPLELHIQRVDLANFEARMQARAKPTYTAIDGDEIRQEDYEFAYFDGEEELNVGLEGEVEFGAGAEDEVALMLVPDNETFISSLVAKDENYDDLKLEIETLVSLLVPYLEQIHSILKFYHLDRLKSN
ncbi:hypothetical protein C1H46_000847 [Malus baccata]|uniref:Glycolipid transfer protein domain-containing protein n=1 Tax=Malus baccata TaxID=106549 RepID=A0A540NR43_MALBA|nr:hypothetical protein C1H46_000847 [Malus baccata]